MDGIGLFDGTLLGAIDGKELIDGNSDGLSLGNALGCVDGDPVGNRVGFDVG